MPSISVILLAAGYGTRLQNDLLSTPHLRHLSTIPKPLLPISGKPLLSHWLDHLTHPLITHKTIITNSLHAPQYEPLKSRYQNLSIITNCTTTNATRKGAIADLHQAINTVPTDVVLIIAADTLLPSTDTNSVLDDFLATDTPAAVLAYRLDDISDARRRGILAITKRDKKTFATRLVEKPAPEEAPSNLATAPVYLLRGEAIKSVDQFLELMKGHPLEKVDAPGHWLSWLITKLPCEVFQVPERLDIGGLAHYKYALWRMASGKRHETEPAVGRAFPRVGLLGNPSDGYGGRVIAFTAASEGFAEVVAVASDKFRVRPNEKLEIGHEWDSVGGLVAEVNGRGLAYGARKLVLAAVAAFMTLWKGRGDFPNCELSYETSIPERVGLAGSSALVLATFRALSRFAGTTMEQICPDLEVWPELMRKVETEYLGIACGLMDRVVQVLHGVVWMDFSGVKWEWERLPEELPDMWLAYSRNGGECSGKVHGGLTKRFLDRDPVVKEVTDSLCALVDEGRVMVERGQWEGFPELVARNFEMRCRLVGLEVVGQRNRRLVDVARKAGFAAKMTGSGGCALCVPDPVRELLETEVDSARRQFEEAGFMLRKVKVLKGRPWGS